MQRATRHKSCLACIQTKRKCDRTKPQCQRCIARGSNCQYLGPRQGTHQQIPEQSALIAPVTMAPDWHLPTSGVTRMTPAITFSPILDQQLFEFPHHLFNLSFGIQPPMPSLGHVNVNQPSNIGDLDGKLYARVDYCATRLSLLPSVLASSGQNMFIHRKTFQTMMSPLLQQAMSACALYCMKTPMTRTMVHQLLQRNVQHLLTTSHPSSSSNSELLAALQALLLYQLMRLFDGDVRLRAAAENDESTSILWASELRTRICTVTLASDSLMLSDPIGAPSSNAVDWQTWLLSESMRRTVVTTFLLRGVYNYLKSGIDSPTVMDMCFTVQEGLWNSQSEVGWRRAREERLELQVLVNCWDDMMTLARPGDMEELGVLVMSMIWGLEATQRWLGHECSVRHELDNTMYCRDTNLPTTGIGV